MKFGAQQVIIVINKKMKQNLAKSGNACSPSACCRIVETRPELGLEAVRPKAVWYSWQKLSCCNLAKAFETTTLRATNFQVGCQRKKTRRRVY